MKRTRVLIAETDPLARGRVRRMLESQPDFEVVGEADDGPVALRLAAWLHPDLLILGAELPGFAPVHARALREETPQMCVVVLTDGSSLESASPLPTSATTPLIGRRRGTPLRTCARDHAPAISSL